MAGRHPQARLAASTSRQFPTREGIGQHTRGLAWEILVAVENGRFADVELGRSLARQKLDPRDRGLVARLVYGTLSWQGRLDTLIARCGRDPRRIDTPIRVLLRLALYQLAELTRVPDFAAVNTTVQLSKTFRRGAASGFVNAVLRRFLREREELMRMDVASDRAEDLAQVWSHPAWLVERWLGELGIPETRALLVANNEPAPTVLRVNRTRTSRESLLDSLAKRGLSPRATQFAPDGIVIEPEGDPATLPGFDEGLFSVQGEASQLVGLLLGVRPGQRIWDACAAPGGKATYAAELMSGRGSVLATDTSARGIKAIRGSANRLGLECITARSEDATRIATGGARFDTILVDAPCSGLGTLRQHPEIKWRRQPEDIAALAVRQQRLLDSVVPRLAPEGTLVYATCTVAQAENDEVVASFLARHPEFSIADPRPFLPAAAHAFVDSAGFLRTFPHRGGLDGFFAVRLSMSAKQ